MVNKKLVKCYICEKDIDKEKEKYVILGTYEKTEFLCQEDFFHIKCFKRWFDKKVNEKSRASISNMQKKAVSLFDNMKGLMGNNNMEGMGFGGMNLKKMLGVNLEKEMPKVDFNINNSKNNSKKKIKKGKTNNGKGNKKTTK